MKIALAQINPHLGNFEYNFNLILNKTSESKKSGAQLVVFPEAALFGYYPMDLLERKSIVNKQLQYIKKLEKKVPEGIAVLFGAITVNPSKRGKPYFNSALFVEKGKKTKVLNKELLPVYDVFDESRHIETGDLSKNIIKFKKHNILISICEDIWAWEDSKGFSHYAKNPLKKIKPSSVDLVINLSGSPYTTVKEKKRSHMIKKTGQYFKTPVLYSNLVGAQDEIIFDGQSIIYDYKKNSSYQLKAFEEDVYFYDFKSPLKSRKNKESSSEKLRRALCLGLYDFTKKTSLKKVHLGLSGGVDSALVAALAADALGPENVTAIALPSVHNASESFELAKKQCENSKIKFHELKIQNIYESLISELNKTLGEKEFSVMHENLQARIRGTLLMAYSNLENSLLLNTSNKSEFSVGYSTLYGDMCGGLSVIGDLKKAQVYELANYYCKEKGWIPERVIVREPSAELRPNQKDSDSLPCYELLDKMVQKTVVEKGVPSDTKNFGFINKLMASEFKRWQAPPILKVSAHAFGRGRRYPIAHKSYF